MYLSIVGVVNPSVRWVVLVGFQHLLAAYMVSQAPGFFAYFVFS